MAKQTTKPAVFVKGPRDEVPVKDVQQETIDKVNNYSEESPIQQSNYVGDATVDVNSIDIDDDTGDDEEWYDISALKDRISIGGWSTLTDPIKNIYAKETQEAGEGENAEGKITVAGRITDIKEDPNTVKGVASVLKASGVGLPFEYTDVGAEKAVAGVAMQYAEDWDEPYIAGAMVDGVKDDRLKGEIMEDAALRAARRGSARAVLYWAGKMGFDRTFKISRKLILTLISNYKRPLGKSENPEDTKRTPIPHTQSGQELVYVLGQIDPAWDRMPNDFGVINLNYYMKASKDAYEGLTRVPQNRAYAAAAKKSRVRTAMSTVRHTFPQLRL